MSSIISHESGTSSSSGIPDNPIPTARNPHSDEFVRVPPSHSNEGVIQKIEQIFESIVDSIINGVELTIPYRTRNTSVPESTTHNIIPTHTYRLQSTTTSHNTTQDGNPAQAGRDPLMFPAQNVRKQIRFMALFRILTSVHESLRSGNLISKRSIYYQDVELFGSQGIVDNIVDNLAFTLGVGRGDLNIVSAAKGLIAGPIDLKIRYGSIIQCGLSKDSGVLLPSINSVEAVNFHTAKWLLIIEKEAIFRTLAASEYYSTSQAGPGILITAKGYPDLATRRFLHVIRSIRPEMALFALVDFDPHGISIFRTYESGSKRLGHEQRVTIPGLKWLGICREDIRQYIPGEVMQAPDSQSSQSSSQSTSQGSSQSSESQPSQESIAYSFDGSELEGPPPKRPKLSDIPSPDSGSFAPLTTRDRRRAMNLLKELVVVQNKAEGYDTAMEQMRDIQYMLMTNVKAEIQAVDDFGDITDWLDQKLCLHLSS